MNGQIDHSLYQCELWQKELNFPQIDFRRLCFLVAPFAANDQAFTKEKLHFKQYFFSYLKWTWIIYAHYLLYS